jgi:uncharacterized protein (TIGR02145 family)
MCKYQILILIFILSHFHGLSQSPDRIPYQSVIRNSSGALLADKPVGLKMSILRGSPTGTVIYAETHRDTTNTYGLAQVDIGSGTVVSGTISGIDWSQGPFYIRVETDPNGGTNYQIVGTTQLLSVPFSLFTKSAPLKYSASGDTLFSGNQYVIVPGLSSANANAVATGSPNVITSVVSSVATTSVSLGGEVLSAGATPVTARGICYGTSAAPTVSNNTVASGSGTGAFTTSLPGLNPATTYYARAYAVNASGTSYGNQVTFRTEGAEGQACAQGSTMTVTHTAGDVAPVTKTVTYKLALMPMNGQSKCWLAQNLGADRQPTTSQDNSEAAAGWYWQFNSKRGFKHDGVVTRTPSTPWVTQISENTTWQTVNDPCNILLGTGWRIPTISEWQLLATSENWFNNAVSIFTGVMRIHAGGTLQRLDGELTDRSVYARFWTSNQGTNERGYFFHYSPINNSHGVGDFEKTFGFSIRCIKD